MPSPLQFATLAQVSVLQLRQALGRLTAAHAHTNATRTAPIGLAVPSGTAALPRTDLQQPEWAETRVDIRHIGA